MDSKICNIGINDMPYGWTTKSEENNRIYRAWKAMHERCYSGKYPSYKDCSVCEEWHKLSNFVKDVKNIENYEIWLKDKNYQLDKDTKIKGNKIYKPDAVRFITASENTTYANLNRDYSSISGENSPMFGISQSGENNPMFGKKHSKESKQKMKENHYNCSGENNPMFGTNGLDSPTSKQIVGLSKDKKELIFLESARNGDKLGFNHSSIIKCCKGKCNIHKGYYFYYLEDYVRDTIIKYYKNKNK